MGKTCLKSRRTAVYCAPEGLALGVMGVEGVEAAEEKAEPETVTEWLRETDALGDTVPEPWLGLKVRTTEFHSQSFTLWGIWVKMMVPTASQGYRLKLPT